MQSTATNEINYRELDDDDVTISAQQLVNGVLKPEDYPPIRDLERAQFQSNQAIKSAHFSTNQERSMAETIQRNTNGWIETTKDVLTAAIHVSGLVNSCAPAITSGMLDPDVALNGVEHVKGLQNSLKRIYNRSCDMAVSNSNELLLAIENSTNEDENGEVKALAQQHRNDLKKFQNGEVDVKVPHQSHAKLVKSVEGSKLIQDPNVREKAKKSSWSWDTALALGGILLAVGIIVITAVAKSKR